MRKRTINRPFRIFYQPLLNLFENWLLVTCITDLKMIHEKLFKLSRPQGQIIDVKMWKIPKNLPFWIFFQPSVNLSKNYLLVTCITNLKRIREKLLKYRKLFRSKMRKIAINRQFWNFFQPLLNLSKNYLLVKFMHNKFEDDTWQTFQVIAPTRSNYWRKMRKMQ